MITELLPHLENLLALGHMGVAVRMAEVAVRFVIKQKTMLKALLQAFHCEGKDEQSSAVVLLSSLTTYDIFYGTMPDGKGESEENNNNASLVRTMALSSSSPSPPLSCVPFVVFIIILISLTCHGI